ncbi:MAG: HlyD family efflux transporter periplasmic adaptor subunit [Rhodocyclaceae bacterium]|nr:HlyD family efflux transporter periplasmic adaptor subunit [Rhodocyclaceae bacterium]MCA3075382.1 HlyD family efflux transporter periplasmic adaptor subunit [Rhodocyclaceae bacterium]MCA3091867.1 HlyD family efflux transporter periplasmic adaptor subunit [Rhodocyclaceae bacterium]MCA3093239.1 HlyD family efflux transporter periplasmic adaptor subunit [Rhodocyclaceae bacterium]MCA3097430.1 HlyD family efflux transporter periplasmic adaptor subunit [Rhodocyclaceae bacterium]
MKSSRVRAMRVLQASALGLLLTSSVPLRAHSEAAPAASGAVAASVLEPRVEAASTDVELLGIVEGSRLVVHVDRFATNEPIDGAKLSLERNGTSFDGKPIGEGAYLFELPWLSTPGSHELLFTLVAGDLSDLLIGTLEIPGPDARAGTGAGSVPVPLLSALAALLALALIIRSARRRRQSGALAALLLAGCAMVLPEGPAQAHESAPAPATGSPKQPSRLPDASVFVPMPAQRAIGLRTQLTRMSTAPVSMELTGTVVADPRASGLVQAPVSGRIEPGPDGLPHAGQRVARGAVLAWLVPTVGVVERSARQAELADLDARIEIARARSERYQQLTGSIPQRDIDAARTEAAALVQRRSAMASGLSSRIALVAPVSGLVSTADAASGQVVDARDLLFRIVDPGRLMVEALGYDASLATGITGGSALTADGRAIALVWVGAAGQLREQALPLLFRVGAGAPALVVGERLRVIAATRDMRTGIVLPAASLVRAANGEPVVWVQSSAERFMPTRVTAQVLDADRIVVSAGLQPEQRVVTASASLLAQIR